MKIDERREQCANADVSIRESRDPFSKAKYESEAHEAKQFSARYSMLDGRQTASRG
jgi:hypothetical protein